MINEKKNKRVDWIDCVKGLGILFVVLGHVYQCNYIHSWIYSFHMPMFFLLSGILLRKKKSVGNYLTFIKTKIISLFIPFVVFRIILIAYWIIVERYFRPLDLGPIWFLLVLFLIELFILPLFVKSKKIVLKITLLVLLIISFYVTGLLDVYGVYFRWIRLTLLAAVWFALGVIIGEVQLKKHHWLIISLLSIVSFFMYTMNGSVSIWSIKTNNFALYIFFGLVGSYGLFFFCRYLIKSNKFVQFLGRNTIVILALHEPIKRIILFSFSKVSLLLCFDLSIEEMQQNYFWGVVVAGLTVLINIVFIYILRLIKERTGSIGTLLLKTVN